jgi:hypothetical protein
MITRISGHRQIQARLYVVALLIRCCPAIRVLQHGFQDIDGLVRLILESVL